MSMFATSSSLSSSNGVPLSALVGRLVLLWPQERKTYKSSGQTEKESVGMVARLVLLDGDDVLDYVDRNDERVQAEVPIRVGVPVDGYWVSASWVVNDLTRLMSPGAAGKPLLGRVALGKAKPGMNRPTQALDPTEDDVALATRWMLSSGQAEAPAQAPVHARPVANVIQPAQPFQPVQAVQATLPPQASPW